jgi:FtsP/CotA-like multicopper oxidase with cupredoxin domain
MAEVPAQPVTQPYRRPTRFLVALFIGGILLTVAVGVLGIEGSLSGGIAGTRSGSPPVATSPGNCQGHGALGNFHFSIVAGAHGVRLFNGSSPGPCFAVAAGSVVTVNFSVSAGWNRSESWELIPSSGPADQLPVFAGAGFSDARRTTGIAPGSSVEFTFNASTPGSYRYVSETPGAVDAGMWGPFNVTSVPLTAVSGTSGATGSALGDPGVAAVRGAGRYA